MSLILEIELDPFDIFLEIAEAINIAQFFPIFKPSFIEEFKPIKDPSPIFEFPPTTTPEVIKQ